MGFFSRHSGGSAEHDNQAACPSTLQQVSFNKATYTKQRWHTVSVCSFQSSLWHNSPLTLRSHFSHMWTLLRGALTDGSGPPPIHGCVWRKGTSGEHLVGWTLSVRRPGRWRKAADLKGSKIQQGLINTAAMATQAWVTGLLLNVPRAVQYTTKFKCYPTAIFTASITKVTQLIQSYTVVLLTVFSHYFSIVQFACNCSGQSLHHQPLSKMIVRKQEI